MITKFLLHVSFFLQGPRDVIVNKPDVVPTLMEVPGTKQSKPSLHFQSIDYL